MGRKGKGWHGESKRHRMAGMGIKTVLSDSKRLHMGNFVADGEAKFDERDYTEYIFEKEFRKGNIIVWDNEGETADRYTILIDGRYVFGMDENPFHPQGFNQFSGDVKHWASERNTPYSSVKEWMEMTDKKDRKLSSTEINDIVKKAILQRMEDD